MRRDAVLARPSSFGLVLIMAVVVALSGLLLYVVLTRQILSNLGAAVALPILVVVGIGGLLLLLTLMAALLDNFGLTNDKHAFGLPDGSIQAVIAIALVLIFVIASLYLYTSLPDAISKANLQAAQSKREFGQQLLTTVGTLAVAVAGFYFGTKSTEAAADVAARAAANERGSVRVLYPLNPTLAVAAGTELDPIVLAASPPTATVSGRVAHGDPDGRVESIGPHAFKYVRGSKAGSIVRLAFELVGQDADAAVLDVREPPTG